jgi:hypothetical protein
LIRLILGRSYARQPSWSERNEVKADFKEQKYWQYRSVELANQYSPVILANAIGREVRLDVAEGGHGRSGKSQSWAAPSLSTSTFLDSAVIKTVLRLRLFTEAGDQDGYSLDIIRWLGCIRISEEVYIAAVWKTGNDTPLLKRAQDLIHRRGAAYSLH